MEYFLKLKKNLSAASVTGALCGCVLGTVETIWIITSEFSQFSYEDALLLLGAGLMLDGVVLAVLGLFISLPVAGYFIFKKQFLDKSKLLLLYAGILSATAFFIGSGYWWRKAVLPWYSLKSSNSLTSYALIIMGSLFFGIAVTFIIRKGILKKISKIKILIPLSLLLLMIAYIPFKHKKESKNEVAKNSPNVLILTIDTLRSDHLSCYGYAEKTSPNIDQLAEESVLFEQAISGIPQTGPSHASIMTAKYPLVHGVVMNGDKLDESQTTLADILSDSGYTTGAFVSAYVLDSIFGLDKGFEIFDDEFLYFKGLSKLVSFKIFEKAGLLSADDSLERRADETNKKVFAWLDKEYKNPFFLWVHYYDPHSTYDPPLPYNSKFDPNYRGRFLNGYNIDTFSGSDNLTVKELKHIKALYDGEINFTDFQIGRLFRKLKELEIYDNTIIIITSDHGEDLMEHGFFGHQNSLYDTTLKIPFIIKFNNSQFSNRKIKAQVQLIDIMPTLLESLGIQSKIKIQGKSLMSIIKGLENDINKEAYSETHSPAARKTKFSVRTSKWKLIHTIDGDEKELYDLQNDPLERKNLISENLKQSNQLTVKLKDWLRQNQALSGSFSKAGIDSEVIKKMKSLGYFH